VTGGKRGAQRRSRLEMESWGDQSVPGSSCWEKRFARKRRGAARKRDGGVTRGKKKKGGRPPEKKTRGKKGRGGGARIFCLLEGEEFGEYKKKGKAAISQKKNASADISYIGERGRPAQGNGEKEPATAEGGERKRETATSPGGGHDFSNHYRGEPVAEKKKRAKRPL